MWKPKTLGRRGRGELKQLCSVAGVIHGTAVKLQNKPGPVPRARAHQPFMQALRHTGLRRSCRPRLIPTTSCSTVCAVVNVTK